MTKSVLILGGGPRRDTCLEHCEALGITAQNCAIDPEAPALDAIAEAARRIHARGVFPADPASVPLAVSVARKLRFPVPPCAGEEGVWPRVWASLSHAACPGELVSAGDDGALEEAAARVGMPCWVRPVGADNGAMCFLVEHEAELELRAGQAAALSRDERALLQPAVPDAILRVLGFKQGRAYIPVAVLGETHSNGPYRIGSALNIGVGVEATHYLPAIALARRAAAAFPPGSGLIECEILITDDGPKLADLRLRTAIEPGVDSLLSATLGIELLDDALRVAVGDAPAAAPSQGLAGVLRWLSSASGVLDSVEGLEAARALPGVAHAEAAARHGATLGHVVDEASRDRIGYVVATAASPETAETRATAACEAIELRTRRVSA